MTPHKTIVEITNHLRKHLKTLPDWEFDIVCGLLADLEEAIRLDCGHPVTGPTRFPKWKRKRHDR